MSNTTIFTLRVGRILEIRTRASWNGERTDNVTKTVSGAYTKNDERN